MLKDDDFSIQDFANAGVAEGMAEANASSVEQLCPTPRGCDADLAVCSFVFLRDSAAHALPDYDCIILVRTKANLRIMVGKLLSIEPLKGG